MEAQRRWSLRFMDYIRWFFIFVLSGYAVLHAWPGANAIVWLRWLVIGITLALWLTLAGILIRSSSRLAAMGHDLLPAGSWSGPFRPARQMLPGLTPWFAIWFSGLVLLLVFFLR
jgi:hypothetical protein